MYTDITYLSHKTDIQPFISVTGTRASLLQRRAERVGAAQPGGEETFQYVKGPTSKVERESSSWTLVIRKDEWLQIEK